VIDRMANCDLLLTLQRINIYRREPDFLHLSRTLGRIVSTEFNDAGLRTRPLAYVLDDNLKVRELVSRMLAGCGFISREFGDSNACTRQIRDTCPGGRPSVIVLDLALGQSDAIDVIRQLEKLKFAGKVLLISGSDESTLNKVQQIGVSHGLAMLPCLRKPFRIVDFKASLDAPPELKGQAPKEVVEAPNVQLEQALLNGWLELWYQPKIELKSLAVCGAEALIRVRHPKFGIMFPKSFMPSAGAPILTPLSKFVMKQAVADWKAHFSDLASPLKLAVNIPLSVIIAPGFMELVRSSLPSNQRFPGLIIEATEGEIIQDLGLAREIITQLNLYNISLSVDDFGSAFSSFSRLRDLSVVELKIDSGFIQNCSADRSKQALCRSVIDLAHRFGALTCAEGLENPEDLRTLIAIDCDMAQGFLFARPQTAQSLRATLAGQTAHENSSASASDRPPLEEPGHEDTIERSDR
jgi:EAL domain-containing protein (putative c-di-GMP-specific phosphodiesterase class I)